MPGRTYQSSVDGYRYGFNGKEDDKAISDGAQDYGMRIYDKRLGRFFSVDIAQQLYPHLSPYNFAANRPVVAIDIEGLQAWDAPNSIDVLSKFNWHNFVIQKWEEILLSKENNFDCADLALEMLAGYHKKMGVNLIVKVFTGTRTLILDSNDPKYQDNVKKDAGGIYYSSYEYFLDDLKKWISANALAQKTISYKIKSKDLETGDLVLYMDDSFNRYFHTQVINQEYSEPENEKPHGFIQSSGEYKGRHDPANSFSNPQLEYGPNNYNTFSSGGFYRFNFLNGLQNFNEFEMPQMLPMKKLSPPPEPEIFPTILPIPTGGGTSGGGGSGCGCVSKPMF